MKKVFLSFIPIIAFILTISCAEPVSAISLNDLTGCSVNKTQKDYYNANFDEELKKRGIPKSIKKNGRTYSINKSFAVNNCLPIYGTPSQMPKTGKKAQRKDMYGNWKYLGYSVDGTLVENAEYVELGGRADYLKVYRFVKEPWKDSELQKSIKKSNSKPYTSNPHTKSVPSGKTRTGLLDTAIDQTYLRYASNPFGSGGLGARGYFVKANDYTGVDWRGQRLINYASVDFFPKEYSFGAFNMYRYCGGDYCFSTYYMPPLKKLFDENIDVAITSFAASTTTPWEGNSVKFTATVKNKGEVTAKDLVVRFTYAGNNYKTTLKGNLKPGKSKNVSVTLRSPQVSKDTNYTAKVVVNENGNNPRFESDRNNNSRTLNITVKNIERDLYVHSIEIDGNEYFDGNKDKLAKLFEGEEVKFRYKLGFKSNKSDEKLVNPVVFYGKEGGKQKEEQITRTIRAGEVTGWINPSFKYSQ